VVKKEMSERDDENMCREDKKKGNITMRITITVLRIKQNKKQQ
jgi:hypothetical protein